MHRKIVLVLVLVLETGANTVMEWWERRRNLRDEADGISPLERTS